MTAQGTTTGAAAYVVSPDLLERATSWRDDDPDESDQSPDGHPDTDKRGAVENEHGAAQHRGDQVATTRRAANGDAECG